MPTPLDNSLQLQPQAQSQNKVAVISTAANRTRFVGKHSRDGKLSVFLQHRNSNIPGELIGLVRVNRDAVAAIAEGRSGVVMVGVMARLLCDTGLQYSEHFVYQRETCIYPPEAAQSTDEIELIKGGGVLGDAVMPDEFHRGFRIKLPAALPPSTIFLSPDTSTGPGLTGDSPWGLTYYLYAYLQNHNTHHRKSSKVFLSFTRGLPSDSDQLVRETSPPAVTVTKTNSKLLSATSSSSSLSLSAALDRAFFYTDDLIPIHIKLNNPRSVAFDGIRVTMKQLIITRGLNQQRKVVKVPLATYEFRYIDENGAFHASPIPKACKIRDFPFIVDTLRVKLKPGPDMQHVAVESLLPRNTNKSLRLCPSFSQFYEMQDNPLKFFAVEYYMNVHVILPWGSNLIAKLPFTVASNGVPKEAIDPSATSIDNLTTLSNTNNNNNNNEDYSIGYDNQYFNDERILDSGGARNHIHPKPHTTPNINDAKSITQKIDYKKVKSDFEGALKLLQLSTCSIQPNHQTALAFVKMRRTWVREFSESFSILQSSHFSQLDNLLEIIMTGRGKETYVSGFPADLARELKDKFVPLYRRFMQCHQSNEHIGILEEALNQAFDTLELVFMKLHLLCSSEDANNDAVEVNLDDLQDVLQGRLRKEFDKLSLVIPGLIEWRWLIEELFYRQGQAYISDTAVGHEDDDLEMVKLFQSIHARLTESFSDAQIDSAEILKYAQLLFQTNRSPQALKSHQNYFCLAIRIYYGNYSAVCEFDGPEDEKCDDLKKMREKLGSLREQLIQSMM